MQIGGHELTANKKLSIARLSRGFLGLLAFLLFVRAVIFLVRAALVISYPFDWSTMDGYFVYYGQRLVSGAPIYFGYETILMPFEYVPLYPAVIGILAKIFGPAVWYERSVAVGCSLVIALVIGWATKRATDDKLAAVVSALLFFAPASLSVWYIVRGLDVLALLLALAGLYVMSKSREGGECQIAIATCLFVLAFFAKQTTVFQAMAAIAYMLCRNKKKGIILAMCYGGTVVAIVLLLQVVTEGWFYENAFLTTSRNPYYPSLLFGFLKDYFLCLFVAFPAALIAAGRGFGRRPDIWILHFLFSLLSAILAGKVGAALSYFLPLFSATCICVGLFLGDSDFAKRRPIAACAMVVLMLVQTGFHFRSYVPVPTDADRRQAVLLNEHIKSRPGELLIERIDSFATLNGRELNIEAVQLPILILRRKFDADVLAEAIKEKRFSLIVYSGVYFSGIPSVKQSIFDNYRIIDEIRLRLFYGDTTFLVLAPR